MTKAEQIKESMDDNEYIARGKLLREITLQANRSALGEFSPPHLSYGDMLTLVKESPAADVVERNRLKQLIANKYGDLDNARGCNINGQWLSVAAIVELIDQAEKG